MKSVKVAVIALAVLASPAGYAAESAAGKSQANRMSQCSAEAKERGLKGDARKEHMSVCLRNPGDQAAARQCNDRADEKGLKGERRRDFVDDCVKAKAPGRVG